MSSFENITIPVYCIFDEDNFDELKFKGHFLKKKEFDLKNINFCDDKSSNNKWVYLRNYIKELMLTDDDFFILSINYYGFSTSYSKEYLFTQIINANQLGCKILLGNLAQFNFAVPVTQNLFWIDSFSCASLIVVFRNLFEDILQVTPEEGEDIFSTLSYITSHKMALFPFIANLPIQFRSKKKFQEFGSQLFIYQSIYNKYIKSGI